MELLKSWQSAAEVPTGCCLLLLNGNHANLNVYKFWQGGYLHRFPCRKITAKVFAVDFIDLAELVHIGDKDGGLYHVAEVHAGLGQNGFQVLHHLVCFILYVTVLQLARLWVKADLAGYIQCIVDENSLVVWSDGSWSALGGDDLFFHYTNYRILHQSYQIFFKVLL